VTAAPPARSPMRPSVSDALITDYHAAIAEFRSLARAVSADAWHTPRQPGKWTPSQEVEHIVLSHELFLSQLRGGPPMTVIVSGWRLILLRLLVLPYILRTGRFPRARAPRESRPVASGAPREQLLRRLDDAAGAVIEVVAPSAQQGEAARLAVASTSGPARFRHPYFGMMTIPQIVRLSTVHTRHHAAHLPRVSSR
jgi:hypothetical protein